MSIMETAIKSFIKTVDFERLLKNPEVKENLDKLKLLVDDFHALKLEMAHISGKISLPGNDVLSTRLLSCEERLSGIEANIRVIKEHFDRRLDKFEALAEKLSASPDIPAAPILQRRAINGRKQRGDAHNG